MASAGAVLFWGRPGRNKLTERPAAHILVTGRCGCIQMMPAGWKHMTKMEKWTAVVSWVMFFLIFLVICVLSFQSGSATKAFEKPFVESVTGAADQQLSKEAVLTITFYIRQAGRFSFLPWASAAPAEPCSVFDDGIVWQWESQPARCCLVFPTSRKL